MKHIFLMAIAFVAAITLGSCDKVGNDGDEKSELDNSYFSMKYTINADGCCVLEGEKPLAKTEIASKVTGYGWKTIGTYEVQDDGHLSTTDYWHDRYGGSPTDYWFESASKLTSYFFSDAQPDGNCFHNLTWQYDANKGFIMRKIPGTSTNMPSAYMQVLKIHKGDDKTLMYTMQKLGSDSDGKNKFGMVVYQRMTDKELSETKNSHTNDINASNNVPDNCKFNIKAYYADDNDEDTNPVFQTFRRIAFEITDDDGQNSSSNAYYNYYDSITWTSDCRDMPDSFGIVQRTHNSSQIAGWWSSYFFAPVNDYAVLYANGYKNGHIVYSTHTQVYLVNNNFFGYSWDGEIRLTEKAPELTEYCLLDKSREFILTPPTAYKGDPKTPYAELRVVPKNWSGKTGPDEYAKARLEKQCSELVKVMDLYYGKHTTIKSDADRKKIIEKFKTLPADANIKAYWTAEHSRMALVLNEDKDEPMNSEYYIKAEPEK